MKNRFGDSWFPFYFIVLLISISCHDNSLPKLEGSYHGNTENGTCPTCFITSYRITMGLKNNVYSFQYVSDHAVCNGSYDVIGKEIIFDNSCDQTTQGLPGYPQGKYKMEVMTTGVRFFRVEADGMTHGYTLIRD